MTVYIDGDYKCGTAPAEGLRAVETEAFEGKCKRYIEGCRFVPAGCAWVREDGEIFTGEMLTPWRDLRLLEELQALCEEEQAKQADMAAALETIYAGVTENDGA